MNYFKIPSLEQIYNEYHKQTFFAMRGTYPKPLTNFDKIQDDQNIFEQLTKFQNLLARNREAINWKIYMFALAQNFKSRFDLRILSNLSGIKIYRNYIQSKYKDLDNEEEIYNEIINSLMFLNGYLKENNLTFKEYLEIDRDLIPLALKHIYSGTISLYFYALFDPSKVAFELLNYSNDLFLEYFSINKDNFIETFIINKHKDILKFKKIKDLMEKILKIIK